MSIIVEDEEIEAACSTLRFPREESTDCVRSTSAAGKPTAAILALAAGDDGAGRASNEPLFLTSIFRKDRPPPTSKINLKAGGG
jgi:hypothetical protein